MAQRQHFAPALEHLADGPRRSRLHEDGDALSVEVERAVAIGGAARLGSVAKHRDVTHAIDDVKGPARCWTACYWTGPARFSVQM